MSCNLHFEYFCAMCLVSYRYLFVSWKKWKMSWDDHWLLILIWGRTIYSRFLLFKKESFLIKCLGGKRHIWDRTPCRELPFCVIQTACLFMNIVMVYIFIWPSFLHQSPPWEATKDIPPCPKVLPSSLLKPKQVSRRWSMSRVSMAMR